MPDWAWFGLFLGVWVVLQVWVLPWLGVST